MTNSISIKKGDILAGVYHYGMTIPHFYVVTKVTPSGCKVLGLDSRMVRSADGGYNQQGWMVPVTDAPDRWARERQARLTAPGEWKIGSGSSAMYISAWDGRPMYADFCD